MGLTVMGRGQLERNFRQGWGHWIERSRILHRGRTWREAWVEGE